MNTFNKVAVIGGAGFIGSHLVEALLPICSEISVVDNLSTGKKENLPIPNPKIFLYEKNILKDNIIDAILGSEVVFHLAALTSVEDSLSNPWSHFETNTHGTLKVVQAAVKSGVKKLIFSSTAAVYGETLPSPQTEENRTEPKNAYGVSKLAAEKMLKNYCDENKIQIACLRYFNVYGPRQPSTGVYSSVLARFLSQYKNNDPLTVTGFGDSIRDFVYVKDVCAANILAAQSIDAYETYNVCTGNGQKIIEIAKQFKDDISFILPRKEVKISIGDPKFASNRLHWRPKTNLYEWIEEEKMK
jgi:UDP-glucose 4-epimerase